MKKSSIDQETRAIVQEQVEPYLAIDAISESKSAVFFYGQWKFDGAKDQAKQLLHHPDKEIRIDIQDQDDKGIIRITNGSAGRDKPKYWLHALLFFITIITTLFAGALMEGVVPWPNLLDLRYGIPFSATLLLILGTHEAGHYLAARYHNIDATLPYFIPAPTFIGTFGAFIKMKSPIVNKRALLEIGAAGPIAGFVVTVPALILGLKMSTVVDTSSLGGSIELGDSLFMWLGTQILYPNLGPAQDIMLSPVGFAAWIGLLVTALNLLPIGQLDGGHIAYAMFGEKHTWIARIAFFALIPLSLLSLNWLIWAVLIFFLIRIQHPPILAADEPLPFRQKVIGWVSLAILVGTFIPEPFVF